MIYISHRGNINGKNIEKENTIEYITKAIELGFDVEIDVWYDNGFWLGHDNPITKISNDFFKNDKLWCHAKNLEAIENLALLHVKYFWHENDKYTLTSNNLIWTYPGQKLCSTSICVLPELDLNNTAKDIYSCYGICSDFIIKWKNKI